MLLTFQSVKKYIYPVRQVKLIRDNVSTCTSVLLVGSIYLVRVIIIIEISVLYRFCIEQG